MSWVLHRMQLVILRAIITACSPRIAIRASAPAMVRPVDMVRLEMASSVATVQRASATQTITTSATAVSATKRKRIIHPPIKQHHLDRQVRRSASNSNQHPLHRYKTSSSQSLKLSSIRLIISSTPTTRSNQFLIDSKMCSTCNA